MPGFDLDYWKRWEKTTQSCAPRLRRQPQPDRQLRAPRHAHESKARAFSFAKAQQRTEAAPAATADVRVLRRGRQSLRAPLLLPGGAFATAGRPSLGGSQRAQGPGPGEHAGANASAFGKQSSSRRRSLQGAKFSRAPRRTFDAGSGADGGGDIGCADSGADACTRASAPSFTFARATREELEPKTDAAQVPGPGSYRPVERGSEAGAVVGPPPGTSSFAALAAHVSAFEPRQALPSAGFGHGCDVAEHVALGHCAAGRCSGRAPWERQGGLPAASELRAPVSHSALQDTGRGEPAEAWLEVLCQVDLNEADHRGRTALHFLAASGEFVEPRAQVLKASVFFVAARESGQQVDVDARDCLGDTALHLAVRTEQTALADVLLQHGADPEAENNAGETPMDEAVEMQGAHRMYQVLRARVAMSDARSALRSVHGQIGRSRTRSTSSQSQSQSPSRQRSGSAAFPSSRAHLASTPFGGLPPTDD